MCSTGWCNMPTCLLASYLRGLSTICLLKVRHQIPDDHQKIPGRNCWSISFTYLFDTKASFQSGRFARWSRCCFFSPMTSRSMKRLSITSPPIWTIVVAVMSLWNSGSPAQNPTKSTGSSARSGKHTASLLLLLKALIRNMKPGCRT